LREVLKTNHTRVLKEHNLLFAVKRVTAEYKAPARLDDLLEISTEVMDCGAATLDIRQNVSHEGRPLAELTVTLVAISPAGKVLRLPEALRGFLPAVKKNARKTRI
jgi:acyl-CoA thioester hydrolase